MDFVAVEPPPTGPASGFGRNPPQFFYVALGVVPRGELFEVFADKLVQALP
jgi:hypothetical protein